MVGYGNLFFFFFFFNSDFLSRHCEKVILHYLVVLKCNQVFCTCQFSSVSTEVPVPS